MLKQLTRRTADLSSVLLKILTDAETTVFKACLKEIAIYFSLDPRRVSFHSLWVVGASALAAAGWGSRLYHLGYGSLEKIPCLLKICATDYKDV